ncbi:alpha/beta hydrolase family esterase [Corynebacterium bovis]|uniref:alpha/beta hydrolase family esterase n=1 Tax=Corynebacterium bovis TaxID=36808 RepID=UPI003138BB10
MISPFRAAAVSCVAVLVAACAGVSAQRIIGESDAEYIASHSVTESGVFVGGAASTPDRDTTGAGEGTGDLEPVPDRPPFADAPTPGTTRTVTFTSSGVTRTARITVPADYDPARPLPVLVSFHGWKETADSMERYTGFDALPAIVVYGQGIENAWEGAPYARTNDGQDLRYVLDLLGGLRSTFTVDPARIYAAGMSNGGGFALKLACQRPDLFAGVASVSGAYYPRTRPPCAPQAVPVLEIHGAKDTWIRYDGGVRHGEEYAGPVAVLTALARRNGGATTPVTTKVNDGVLRLTWAGDSPVDHLRVAATGHVWPRTADIDATQAVWGFLRAQARPDRP